MKTNTLQQPLYGLGWWNIYLIIKIGLFTQDIIRFHPLENFAFVAFLLLPLKPRALKIIRQCIAVPIGLWLMHFDSFLPPLNRLWGQIGQLLQFNLSYLIELAGRFISPQAFLALFVLIFAYYFLNQVFRISVFVILALVYISLPQSIFNSQAKETVIAQQPTITQTTTP
ncbi:MAG: cellulose biosynthesis protein BcsG [bacterium]